ncbi:hypothetical protein Q4525_04270 [Shimia thalassica]|uniref:hypothetical protein n=1 Tax=Shimia thalassica TaxID=1715693 RepID=UPI001C09B43D|nr:hypothetical protein [Shimia thalassica]MBU2944528.1 hypothetical protein [Shimia thalassica]MDO6502126.1 hypothetical protein [Shimia thalassica]
MAGIRRQCKWRIGTGLLAAVAQKPINLVRHPVEVWFVPVHAVPDEYGFCRQQIHFVIPFPEYIVYVCASNVYFLYIQLMHIATSYEWCRGRMTKSDKKKSSKKDSQLVLRLDKAERDAFVDLCKDLDTSAAREIRRFIRNFMKENSAE